MAITATTAVAESDAGGLPQLDVSTFESQLVWLFLSFAVLFVFIWKIALPKVSNVMLLREETISSDLDSAEDLRSESEAIKASYEQSLAAARKNAHDSAMKARADIQVKVDAASAELDGRLSADSSAAETRIKAARDAALDDLDDVVIDVTSDLVSKLAGGPADQNAIDAAVKAAKET